MDALVLLFATWIAAHTGLAIPPSPSVVVVSAEEMRERSGDRLGVVAFYTRDTATIYLPQGWNSAGIYDRAMLLHELVHHMQQLNRVKTRCGAERERQAHDLTRAWLSEQGISDPYTFLNLDEL